MTEIKIFAEEWFSFPTMDLQERREGMSRGTRWIIHTIMLMRLSAAMAVGAIPAEAATSSTVVDKKQGWKTIYPPRSNELRGLRVYASLNGQA
jgi:hypothetical protein